MTRRLSTDARNSLFLFLAVGGLFAFVLFGARFLPTDDHAVWRNLYLWSSSSASTDDTFIPLFVMAANNINNAGGRPPRPWLESVVLVTGLAGLILAVSLAAVAIPRVGLIASVFAVVVGGTSERFLLEGAPMQVWRNLFASDVDYAGRFFPLVGTVLCLLVLCLWIWGIGRRWNVHDYTSVTDAACFALGMVGALVGGRRRQNPTVSAVIA